MKPGETPLEAAVREVAEGARRSCATGGRMLGDVRYIYTWEGELRFKIVSFFLLRAAGGRMGDLAPGMEIRGRGGAVGAAFQDAGALLDVSGGEQEGDGAEGGRGAAPRVPRRARGRGYARGVPTFALNLFSPWSPTSSARDARPRRSDSATSRRSTGRG